MNYPESIDDYRKLHSVQRNMGIWNEFGEFLLSPVSIIGSALVWEIYLILG